MRQPEHRSAALEADDDPTIRGLVREVVTDEAGVNAVLATDGAEALAPVQAVHPTVLLDTQMPRVDGAEVARRLKADPATRAIPIVGLSAEERRGAALAARCDALVAKPFDLDNLLAVLRAYWHAGERRTAAATPRRRPADEAQPRSAAVPTDAVAAGPSIDRRTTPPVWPFGQASPSRRAPKVVRGRRSQDGAEVV